MVNLTAKIADKLGPRKDPKVRVCSICGKRYKTEPAFKVHMQMKHNNNNNQEAS
jgi:hypothetical protein